MELGFLPKRKPKLRESLTPAFSFYAQTFAQNTHSSLILANIRRFFLSLSTKIFILKYFYPKRRKIKAKWGAWAALLFGCWISTGAIAQNETAYWFFGTNGGLRFVDDVSDPVVVTGSAMSAFEGCAVISDVNGQLLFYTDGTSVWNKNHQPTPNGFGLLGSSSATQAAVIVPRPGSNRYYIFTAPALENTFNNENDGIRFTEVDMSLDGGLGDVIADTKNTLLITPACEKITASRTADGAGYWALGHEWNSNRYFAFKITSGGVDMNPVISAVGTPHDNSTLNMAGYMKASPDGKKIGVSIQSKNMGEVLDFDPATGQLSNPVSLPISNLAYGFEFSPDSKRAYIGSNPLYQYDLTAGDANAIQASQQIIGNTSSSYVALQLARNGKIYVVRPYDSMMGVIHAPNLSGDACNYVDSELSLSPGSNQYGLPSFIQTNLINPCENSDLRFFSLFKKAYVCTDCIDGKIAAAGIGGVKPYQYSLDNLAYQNSGAFGGLAPGVYTVYIRDAAGCIVKRKVFLN